MDVYFLSRQALVFYNATLETTACAFREKAEDLAFDSSCKLRPYHSSLLERLGKGNTVDTDDLEEPIIAEAGKPSRSCPLLAHVVADSGQDAARWEHIGFAGGRALAGLVLFNPVAHDHADQTPGDIEHGPTGKPGFGPH